MQAHKQDGHLTAGAWARKVTDERVLCSVPLFLTCEPSIAPTTFGKSMFIQAFNNVLHRLHNG